MCGFCTGLLAGADVLGFTRDQCMVSIGNIDARIQLLVAYPYLYLQVKTLGFYGPGSESWQIATGSRKCRFSALGKRTSSGFLPMVSRCVIRKVKGHLRYGAVSVQFRLG
jgi:hypothetical protein